FAMIGLIIVYSLIPESNYPKPSPFNKALVIKSFLDKKLLQCHLGIWCQHFILTSSFFAIPLILKQSKIALPSFYLSLMLTAFIIMLPLIGWAERKNMRVKLFHMTLILLILGQVALCLVPYQLSSLWGAMFVYFLGFNVLEALFPAMLARAADPSLKGTASGIYSSLQFLGIFFGGMMSGFIYKYYGVPGIFVTNTILANIYTLFIFRNKD
ncbi:MAG: MFS transporter, partial [Cyanobacteria bacterium K_DeepCast_35m_m2_023]|nr:MFS transporter [Cyanobacteria bacterium K_DeepCast_35m_m2_023]